MITGRLNFQKQRRRSRSNPFVLTRGHCARMRGGQMRTLYYVVAGGRHFGFYVEHGTLALADNGTGFKSLTDILTWAVDHEFDRVARCEPERSQPVPSEVRRCRR